MELSEENFAVERPSPTIQTRLLSRYNGEPLSLTRIRDSMDYLQEGLPRELLLFHLPVTQTAVTRTYYVDCRPVSQISETRPVEFHIAGTGDYLDLKNSLLYVKARIVKADGTALIAGEKVGPVNNFLHSLFNQIDLSLNGKQFPISGSAVYAYKTYLIC